MNELQISFYVTATLFACALFGIVVGSGSALGAVRLCHSPVTSNVFADKNLIEAKRQAIKDWINKSKEAGIEHPSWRIANFRVLKCVERAAAHECVAHGAPCTIKQKVPPLRKQKAPTDWKDASMPVPDDRQGPQIAMVLP